MKGVKSYIELAYKLTTGITFLVIYLVGFGLSIYSTLPATHSTHSHSEGWHCTMNFCTCSHEEGECTCGQNKNTENSDHLVLKKCPTPVSDTYTGSTISIFIVEELSTFQSFLSAAFIHPKSPLNMTEFLADPPLHPPKLV